MPEPTAVAAKNCTVCAIDVSKRPRVKDQQGRYMCQECFDKVKHTKQVQKAPPVVPLPAARPAEAPDINLNDNSFLLDMGVAKQTDAPGAKACPECGRGMTASAVVCIGCGYNTQTGKRLTLKVERAKKVRESSAAAELGSSSLFCIIGGVIGGAVGAALWAAVTYFTQYEVGYVAWAVGGLAGAGCAMGARGYSGVTSGLLAAGIALASVGAGKYFAGVMILQKLGFANMPVDVWFPKTLSFFDLLWAFLAVGTAFKVGSADLGGD